MSTSNLGDAVLSSAFVEAFRMPAVAEHEQHVPLGPVQQPQSRRMESTGLNRFIPL